MKIKVEPAPTNHIYVNALSEEKKDLPSLRTSLTDRIGVTGIKYAFGTRVNLYRRYVSFYL